MSITPNTIASFFGHTFLSYDALDETAREYDFSENWNPDAGWRDERGWKVADHPDVESQADDLETVEVPTALADDHRITVELDGGNNRGSEFTVSLPDFDEESDTTEDELLKAVRTVLAEFNLEEADTAELGDSINVGVDDDGFGELCELVEIDSAMFEEDDPEDNEEQWHPMMNYLYPIPQGIRGDNSDTWHRVMCNMTVVEADGETALALTGGGMNMTWYICETYLRCGYLPPATFASRLPRMSGSGESEKDRMIMAACKLTLEAKRDRAISALEDLERHMTETEVKAS